MANRYGVVARTYLRWPLASALIVVLVPVCLAAAGVHQGITDLLAYHYLTLGFFAWSLGTHVKEQFANPRAVLLPDFRRPHLVVAAAVAVPVLVWATAAICRVGGTSLPGTAAVVLTIFTSFLWWGYWPTWTWLPSVLILFPLAFPLRRSVATALVEGQAVLVSALLLLVCIALLVTLVKRLVRLDDEMPEYHVPLLTRLVGRGLADERRTWSTWGQRGGQPDFLPRSMPADGGKGFWGRVRLWRVGMSDVNFAALEVRTLLFVLLPFVLIEHMTQTNYPIFNFAYLYGIIFASGMPVMLLRRWPRLGYELLRPTTRRDFCRQMGLAFACEGIEPYLWLLLFIGFLAAVWSPGSLRSWDLAVYLVLLVCMWLGQWAATAWIVSYSRSALLLLPAVYGISYVPFKVWMTYRTSSMPFATEYYLTLSLGMMLLCGAALYLAYRRWQRLDLP